MFSIIGVKIKAELDLSETEFGLLVATPILTGSLIRLPLGILTDRYGGRIVYFFQMLAVVVPTWMLSYATEYWEYLVLGLFVGVAGGSFAVGIAYTSAWFSKERQGTAMGIFGAGNAGSSAHEVHRATDHRGLRDRLMAHGSEGLCGRDAGDGNCVLVHDDSRPAASEGRADRPQGSQAVGAAVALARRWSGAWGRPLLRVRRLRRARAMAAQVLRWRIWPAAGDRGLPDPVRPAVRSHPCTRPMASDEWQEYGHLVGHVDQPDLHVHSELSAHDKGSRATSRSESAWVSCCSPC